jgi:hypothetical protein
LLCYYKFSLIKTKINIAVYSHMRFNMSIICLFLIKLVIFVLLSILYTLSWTIKGRPGLISHFTTFSIFEICLLICLKNMCFSWKQGQLYPTDILLYLHQKYINLYFSCSHLPRNKVVSWMNAVGLVMTALPVSLLYYSIIVFSWGFPIPHQTTLEENCSRGRRQ